MKETKIMMGILSENKRKVQVKEKQLRKTKEHAEDILKATWLCVGMVVYFIILAMI